MCQKTSTKNILNTLCMCFLIWLLVHFADIDFFFHVGKKNENKHVQGKNKSTRQP